MKKNITIVILFFSCLSFAQARLIETVSIEKTNLVENSFCVQKTGIECILLKTESFKKNDFVTDENYAINNKKRINGFTENVLYDLKLVLPRNLVWLFSSIV